MILNICITRLCNITNKILPYMGIMKPYYEVLSISILKCNIVQSISSQQHKMTLSPDALQKKDELKGLIEVYNQYRRSDIGFMSGFSTAELSEFLGVSITRAGEIMSFLTKEMTANSIPYYYFKDNLELFKMYKVEMGNTSNENLLKVFKLSPLVTEARLDVMSEAKLKMSFRNLSSLVTIGKQTVEELECSNILIPNLPQYVFENLKAPEYILNLLPTPDIYRQLTFSKLWVDLQQVLLHWKLSSEDGHLNILEVPIPLVKVFISLRTLANNICIFKKEFKFCTQKILTNPKILTCHHSNLKKYTIQPDPILRYFIIKVPEILIKPYEGAMQILAMLHYISEGKPLAEACGYVFVLSSDNVLRRLERLIRTTSLTDLRLTPNYGWLIYKIDRCLSNLDEDFIKMEVKCFPAVRILEKVKGSFYSRKSAILLFLNEILNLPATKDDLRLMNMVLFPELPCIKKNFVFLYQNGFSLQDIKESYHVLLFPHSIIVENYFKLNACSYANEFRKNNDKSKLLQLLIYYTSIYYKEIGGSY